MTLPRCTHDLVLCRCRVPIRPPLQREVDIMPSWISDASLALATIILGIVGLALLGLAGCRSGGSPCPIKYPAPQATQGERVASGGGDGGSTKACSEVTR